MTKPQNKKVFLDCDGNADDLIAFLLLRLSSGLEVIGTVITNADCYVEHSYEAVRRIENFLAMPEIEIGLWKGDMPNPFPDAWRKESLLYKDLPVFEPTKLAAAPSDLDAIELMKRSLEQSSDKVTVICTGPFTVLAEVLRLHPELAHKISEIVAMAGAIRVDGNVVIDGTDGTAEWNVYCDPESFKSVLESGIPIRLIPLDVTNQLPVEKHLLRQLETDSKKSKASAVAFELLELQKGRDVFLWDPTTVIAVTRPELFRFETVNLDVVTSGKSSGKLRLVSEGQGHSIECSTGVMDKDQVVESLLTALNQR